MTRFIISEDEAEQIGRQVSGGERDIDFTVFRYRKTPENLTLFGVEIAATKEVITGRKDKP